MTTPQKTIIDCVTGETMTRDFDETELAEYTASLLHVEKEIKAKLKAEKTIADTRQTILDRLGITKDELLTILS